MLDYALDVPMYFVYRDGHYIDAAGQSFRDFLDGQLPGLPGEKPLVADWTDHLSTTFPEVRLKSFLEMRGADGGPWSRICALPALWVGLLYDEAALDAAWDVVKDWTLDERQRCATRCRSSASTADDPGGETLARARQAGPRHRRSRAQRARPAQQLGRQRIRLPRSAARGPRLAARRRPSGCSTAIMANGAATSRRIYEEESF